MHILRVRLFYLKFKKERKKKFRKRGKKKIQSAVCVEPCPITSLESVVSYPTYTK